MLPALLVSLPLGFFIRALASGGVFIAGDTLRVFYPTRVFWAERVSQFSLPEWFPYDGFGQSFVGAINAGAFHPTALLHLVLPPGAAGTATFLCCYLLALVGTYALMRAYQVPRAGALFSAITFAFCGYLVAITNNSTYLLSASAVPAALWAAVRFLREPSVRRLAAGGALLALVVAGGDAQGFAMVNAAVVLVACVDPAAGTWRRRLGMCLVLVATGGLLAAPQLFPAAALAGSGAPGARSLVESQRFSLAPLRLGELLMGSFLADVEGMRGIPESVVRNLVPSGGFGRVWVDCVYVGTPACVLALAALFTFARRPRAWVLAGAWLLWVMLCLGDALPVYGWVYQWVPPWRPFRYPEKLVPWVSLGLAVAAGLGWRACVDEGRGRRAVAWAAGVVVWVGGSVAVAEAFFGAWSRHGLVSRWPQAPAGVVAALSGNVVRVGVVTAVLALACALLTLLLRARGLRGGLLVALQLGALWWGSEPFYVLAPAELLDVAPPFVEPIRREAPPGEPVRVSMEVRTLGTWNVPGYDFNERMALRLLTTFQPDTMVLWGLESANGYLPGESVRVRELRQDRPHWYGHLAPRLGTPFSVHDTRELAASALPPTARLIAQDSLFGTSLVHHSDALPRVHVARPRCVSGMDEALGLMLASPLPPRDVAVVECATGPLPEASARLTSTVRVERPSPEHLLARVEVSEPAVLVVNDAYQPGWTAWVDGQEAAILPANVAVRAVAVPAGQHHVELRYRTPGLRPGLLVALGTLLALAVLDVVGRRTERKRLGFQEVGAPRGP
ncbi:YfhO family protein [Myxococcus sp. K38C18041901]|uniref:YfhO family protein n=1 Tax=Myxococcus guangdongensis TaxID=2906760 RepID=UPI0020A83673|nr:YfhO family protein [Myxococcus guangdongensis]MCP3063915.1 YfhO family protein [Myxococcus guangdongensis]